MQRTITGLFDSRAEAQAVVDHLMEHDGLTSSQVQMHGSDASAAAGMSGSDDKGFWASLKDLFVPDEDRYAYSEGIRRGGVVVSAQIDETRVEHAMDLFEQHGAVDLDAREADWRKSGWTGYDATKVTPVAGVATTGVAMGATAPMPAAGMSTAARGAALNAGTEEVIPIVEERLRVGKRAAEGGRVRVRSYVVETPVSE